MSMNGDWMRPEDNYDFLYKVSEMTRTSWDVGGPTVREGSIIFFTDGSKIGTNTGAGIFGPGVNVSVAMGHWPTVFQAEIFAILECVNVCLKRKYGYANGSESFGRMPFGRTPFGRKGHLAECRLAEIENRSELQLAWIYNEFQRTYSAFIKKGYIIIGIHKLFSVS